MKFAMLFALLALAPPQAANISVDGIITQAGSTTPLPSVQVRITGTRTGESRPTTIRTATGVDGRFHFSAPPAEYTLIVQRDGFFGPPQNDVPQPSVTLKLTLVAGQEQPPLSVSLTPGGVITGQIFDSSGLPAGRSAVSAFQVRYRNGQPEMVPVESESSNERGEFRLYWIPAGEYFVSYNPSTISVATSPIVTIGGQPGVEMRTFYPGTTDLSKARAVAVTAGGEVSGINFGIKVSPAFTISGKVVNAYAPAAGPNTSLLELPGFSLISREGAGSNQITMSTFANAVNQTDARAGLFELRGIPAGTYDMFANINTTTFALNFSGRTAINLTGGNVSDLTIPMHPPLDLRGRIVAQDGVTIPEKIAMKLEPAEKLPNAIRGTVEAVASGGDFTFKGLVEASYRLSLDLPPNTYVVSTEDVIRLSATPPEPIQIVLAPTAARITGSVAYPEGKAGVDTTLVLVPDAPLRRNAMRYQTARPDESGKFVINNIAPGTYKLFAWENVFATAWLNADFMKPFEEQGIPVSVSANENVAGLRVNVIPAK